MAFDFREYGAVNYRRILRILIAYSAFLNAYEYYLPKKEKGTDYTPIGTVNKSFYCLQSKDYNNLQVKKRITDNEFEILSLKQFYGEINLSDDVITLITSRYLCKPCSIDSLKLYKNPGSDDDPNRGLWENKIV